MTSLYRSGSTPHLFKQNEAKQSKGNENVTSMEISLHFLLFPRELLDGKVTVTCTESLKGSCTVTTEVCTVQVDVLPNAVSNPAHTQLPSVSTAALVALQDATISKQNPPQITEIKMRISTSVAKGKAACCSDLKINDHFSYSTVCTYFTSECFCFILRSTSCLCGTGGSISRCSFHFTNMPLTLSSPVLHSAGIPKPPTRGCWCSWPLSSHTNAAEKCLCWKWCLDTNPGNELLLWTHLAPFLRKPYS